ncbi:MAG: ribosome silencing factor [Phycisphaerae bacterium]
MATSRTKAAEEQSHLTSDDARDFAIGVARVAADNKTADLVVLDLRGISSLADFFVVGTGTSGRQMHAVIDRIEDFARTMSRKPFKVSDSASSSWILADYVDVVIHLFDDQHRTYYDLDGLWGDAPRLEWSPPKA